MSDAGTRFENPRQSDGQAAGRLFDASCLDMANLEMARNTNTISRTINESRGRVTQAEERLFVQKQLFADDIYADAVAIKNASMDSVDRQNAPSKELNLFQAGVQGAELAHDLTQLTGIEWGGQLYCDASGGLHWSRPVSGTGGEVAVETSAPPFGIEPSGDYHSHCNFQTVSPILQFTGMSTTAGDKPSIGNVTVSAPAENRAGNLFSRADIYSAITRHIESFLGVPSGGVRYFDGSRYLPSLHAQVSDNFMIDNDWIAPSYPVK